jgi:hypothetical protein
MRETVRAGTGRERGAESDRGELAGSADNLGAASPAGPRVCKVAGGEFAPLVAGGIERTVGAKNPGADADTIWAPAA